MEVELGSIYQIDHSKLTPRTPVPLRSIRLVMVSEKTEWNVTVRYPSIESLKRYFNNKFNEIYPEMDERFVMDRDLAERVLFRRVPSEEFLVKKDMEEFWLLMSSSGGREKSADVVSKKVGYCLSELKSSGALGWGVRRQVKFIGRHRETNTSPSSSSIDKRGLKEAVGSDEEAEVKKDEKKEEDEEEEEEKEEEKEVKKEIIETYQRRKRKCCEMKLIVHQEAKKGENEKKKKKKEKNKKEKIKVKKTPKNNSREIVLAIQTPPSNRWSDNRYIQAQKYLLDVMKAKGAFCDKPILRPELRAEARKKIGDTGLLDHLLKHMAGMVAPGGAERFRRRHNANGAMEYWLESADLDELRKQAGVEDPYWTPPPGWKIGDNPTQDPFCAQEIKELKEEIFRLKRAMKGMISRKQMEAELDKLRREIEKKISKHQKKQSQDIVVSNPGQKELEIIPTPETRDSYVEEYYKEQLTILSDHFTRIEAEMVNLKSKVEEKTKVGPNATASGVAAAAKAAKIERLKSGFRICKPQGTFLWPNSINTTSNVFVQVEDMSVVPTPPSVSSSTFLLPPQLPPPSPVRPTPEKRAITVTTTTTTTTNGSSNKTTTWINLNDVPGGNLDGGFCGTSSSRRQTASTTSTVVPTVSAKGEQKQSSAESCSGKGVDTWLALAAPTDCIEGPTRG